jgi:hypothetical protein
MKRVLLSAIAAIMVSATTMAQTVNAATVNVSSKIKLKTNVVTNIQTDLNFSSDSSLPTSKAVKAYFFANVGGGNTAPTLNPTLNYLPKKGNGSTLLDSKIMDNGNNVGINTAYPAWTLDVAGMTNTMGFRMFEGENEGDVLTSDGSGQGHWQTPIKGYTPTVEIEDTVQISNPYLITSICWSPTLRKFLGVSQQCNNATLYTYTSTDGINWTANIANNFILNWQCKISWNNDLKKFIAVGSSSNLACQYNSQIKAGFQMSSDGINWEIHPPSLPRGSYVFVSQYCYSKELNILLATSTVNEIYKSTDKGLTFTLASSSTGMQFYNVYWFKELNKFIAYDQNNTTLKYSTDGDNWTIGNSGVAGIYFSYFSDNFFYDKNVSKIVSLTTLGVGQFISSTDGINWATTGEVNPNAYRLYSYNKYLGKYLYYSNNTSTSFLGTTPLNSRALCYSPELNTYLGISADYSKIIVSKISKY